MFEKSKKPKVVSTAAKRPKKSVLISAPSTGRKGATKKHKAQASKTG